MYNKKTERKWQKKWEAKKLFDANPKKGKKFFITVPYPYVNCAPHVGHSYTFFRTDVFARFKRMQGFNVLYPQGFHATGEPIIGIIERLKQKDRAQIETLKIAGANDGDIENFVKKGPEFVAKFWMKKWIEILKSSGFSIDWRRCFITTTMTPTYSRFIEWQYNTLRKRGYIVQGTHPVIWCPKCQSPTGDHDRLVGEGESPVDYLLLKFPFDDFILPAGTLRPETIYGVTNIWVNPKVEYVKVRVNGETWILTEEAAKKLKDQLKNVKIIGRISAEELIGKRCKNPVNNQEIPILPSGFVDPNSATGIVMSVPSHAPYDWIAIREMLDRSELEQYGVLKDELEPMSVVKTPGLGEHPAIEQCKKMKIKSLKQIEELDKATSIVYKKEFHQGILREICGEYSGLRVSECKEKLSLDFIERGTADVMWETTGRVVCRCTTPNHVKILENQWFLKFSDEKWKNLARRCIKNMRIYPEEARTNFLNTVDWLKDKACTRKTGLGTPLPWDRSWIVETLSDSTIYMAYYTLAGIINKKKITAKKLTDEVFDHIFLNKGNVDVVAKNSGLDKRIIKEMKNEFDYFYPIDLRNSGKDLIQNHLTFFIFHHVAIWPEEKWPKGIAVNGWINVEGEKMSKSKGNIIPLKDLLNQFGADLVRINIVSSSENLDDGDWRVENIKGLKSRFEFLFDMTKKLDKAKGKKIRNIDLYLQSVIQKCIRNATENYEATKFRTSLQYALFESTNSLKWYLKRVGEIKNANKKVLAQCVSDIIKLISPMAPHTCEELWHMLGNKTFISSEKWPKENEKLIAENSEKQELYIESVIEDISEIQRIVKIKPKKISIFIADDWKFKIYEKVLKNKGKTINEITEEIMRSDMKKYGKATVAFIQSLYKKINELQPIIKRKKEFEILEEAKKFLETETTCKITITDEQKSDKVKAKQARPMKPALYLE